MPNQTPPWRRRAATAAWLTITVSLVSCAADPGARRTRRVMSEEDEITLGAEAAQQVEQYMGFSGSADLNAYVDRIGQRLAKHSSRSHLVHEFHVVDMKEPNAFALPGGHIYVSRGLLAIMNSEDELAAVLGHEIGHVEGRHSAKQQTKSRGWIPLQILAGIGGAAASVVSPGLGGAVASMGQLPASLVLASYSRNQEKEADRFGQQYAAAEGWDPAALSATMDALSREQQLAGGGDPNQMSFLDSHPTTPERAREGREFASTLTVAPANRIAIDRTAFVGRLDGLVVGDAARGGVFIDRLFVHPELDFALSFPKAWTYENGASAVLAYPKDESAVLALQVVAEGSDPAAVADEIERQASLLERSEPKEINGLPAVSGVTRIVEQGQEIYLSLTWIAKDDLVYQALGATTAGRWKEHRPGFEAAAATFRAPSEAELQQVYEDRLRLVAASAGETLSAVAKRAQSQWSAERVAAANAMKVSDKLAGSESIKVSKREPYRSESSSGR